MLATVELSTHGMDMEDGFVVQEFTKQEGMESINSASLCVNPLLSQEK